MLQQSSSSDALYDVIVVGGGGSGLAAALSAAQNGARTLLLEKNAAPGGSTGMSVGSITATGTRYQKRKGIVDNPDDHFQDMGRFLGAIDNRENKQLRRILVDNVPDTLEWLRAQGLRFFGPMDEPPHRKPRMHNVLPNSRAYPYVLTKRCREAGVEIVPHARVQKLIRDDEKVSGVEATVGGVARTFRARGGVIIATGDFAASDKFKSRYLPHAAHIDALNPSNTGDGQTLGEDAGGTVVNGDILWGPSLRFAPAKAVNILRRIPAWPILTSVMEFVLTRLPLKLFRPIVMSFVTSSLGPEPNLFRSGAILVNRCGERFCDETKGAEFAIPNQPEKEAYIVFDDRVGQKFNQWPNFICTAPGVAYAYTEDFRRTQKRLYHAANTPEELAASIGVPKDAFLRTLDAHNRNAAIKSGEIAAGVKQGPFHALGPVQSWIVLTEGGMAVSDRHEVLASNTDTPVPGLYAVGSAGQGGLVLAGHGHHLGWAFTSGRRAGRFAAERARSAR
jgi:succinate dehydrogenase/fumarate reductase flavoprotein subunit